jgi:hypothetical protein
MSGTAEEHDSSVSREKVTCATDDELRSHVYLPLRRLHDSVISVWEDRYVLYKVQPESTCARMVLHTSYIL